MAVQKGRVDGIQRFVTTVRKLQAKSKRKDDVAVIVGYTASYALAVHEKIDMKLKGQRRKGKGKKGRYWDPQGRAQAKFLETPAREKRKEMLLIIKNMYRVTGGLEKGLLTAGLFLQRESQKLVPVDTGNLKGTAFTLKVKD